MPGSNSKRYVLFATSFASFIAAFMGSGINVALPTIGRQFQVGAVTLAWVTTSYMLALAACLLPFGRLADLYGRRRNFALGVSLYVVTSLLCALANSAALLIAFRVLQGIGGAMIFSTSTALLSSAYPRGERGRALGWATAAVYSGLSLGPFIGGILTERLGWRSIFLINLPLGILILGLVLWKIRGEWVEFRGERFDGGGAGIYIAAIIALMIGLERLPSLSGILLGVAGAALLVAFVLWELRSTSPLVDPRLFRTNRALLLSNLAALVSYAATAALAFLLSLYFQYNRGFGPESAGFILIAQPVLQTLASPLAGRLSDRIAPHVVASAGMVMTVVGLVLFTQLRADTPLVLIVGNLAWLGLSFGLFSSPNTNAVMGSIGSRLYGVAAGSLATMRSIGQMTSMAIAMMLLSVFVGGAEITEANATRFLSSARIAFAIFAGLCFLGVFASLARSRVKPDADAV